VSKVEALLVGLDGETINRKVLFSRLGVPPHARYLALTLAAQLLLEVDFINFAIATVGLRLTSIVFD
jgi:hypothetical protein